MAKYVFSIVAAMMFVGVCIYGHDTKDSSFSEVMVDNLDAFADDYDDLDDECENGCLDEYGVCVCNGIHPLKEYKK